VVRPFTVVGAGQRPDMAVARWLEDARRGRPLTVYGSLGRTRDLTDVRDVARVLAALADPRNATTGTVNLGTGRPRTLADVVAAVAGAVGLPVRTVLTTAAAVEPGDTWADTRRLRAAVGFVPVTDLAAAVARQAADRPDLAVSA
jgi:nucleoside-diphosphate-sugar epimerase